MANAYFFFYKVFLSMNYVKVSSPSLLFSLTYSNFLPITKWDWNWSFTTGSSSSSSLQSTYPIQLHWMGCLVQHLDLDLSLTNIKGLSYLQSAQRHGFTAQQLKHLITFNSSFKWGLCLSLTRDLNLLMWLAGWLDDMERCSCIILCSWKMHELLLMSFLS